MSLHVNDRLMLNGCCPTQIPLCTPDCDHISKTEFPSFFVTSSTHLYHLGDLEGIVINHPWGKLKQQEFDPRKAHV